MRFYLFIYLFLTISFFWDVLMFHVPSRKQRLKEISIETVCYYCRPKGPILIVINTLHTPSQGHSILLDENLEFSKCILSHIKT